MDVRFGCFAALDSPIDWQPFEQAAFDSARTNDRLIFLVSGASWCPYSQRLLHRLAQDHASRAALKVHYTCVLVDGDDSPALHARYSGGGWPTIAVLTVDGEPIWRGLQVEPNEFPRLLRDLWADRSHHGAAGEIQVETVRPPVLSATERVASVVAEIVAAYDQESRGFAMEFDRQGPRFPHLDAIDLLLASGTDSELGDDARRLAAEALRQLMDGGLWLQDEGGLRRYAAASDWTEIHEERLLSDNAALLSSLCAAAEQFDEPAFRHDARRVLSWCLNALTITSGATAFAASVRPAHPEVPHDWPVPSLDTSTLIDANSRMVSALLSAGRVLDDESARARGVDLALHLWTNGFSREGGPCHRLRNEGVISGGLVDAAELSQALLDTQEATHDATWLARARVVFEHAFRAYRHRRGGLSDLEVSTAAPGRLRQALRPLRANAIMAENADRIAALTDSDLYRTSADQLFQSLGELDTEPALFASRYALALARRRTAVHV
jgi:uncharacterized protein YyaL (SSP411 family)